MQSLARHCRPSPCPVVGQWTLPVRRAPFDAIPAPTTLPARTLRVCARCAISCAKLKAIPCLHRSGRQRAHSSSRGATSAPWRHTNRLPVHPGSWQRAKSSSPAWIATSPDCARTPRSSAWQPNLLMRVIRRGAHGHVTGHHHQPGVKIDPHSSAATTNIVRRAQHWRSGPSVAPRLNGRHMRR